MISAAEMRLLSKRFYGNKRFLASHYAYLKDLYQDPDKIKQYLQEAYLHYFQRLEETGKKIFHLIQKQDFKLIQIFVQYVANQLIYVYENKLKYEKATCLIELSIYLFETSWEKRWNKDKSFDELRQILVRHSLFSCSKKRPPHSVYVFTLEEIKVITLHFLNTFFRYYNVYFFSFTPLVDLVVHTEEEQIKRDDRDIEIETLRQEAEQYNEDLDPEMLDQLMKGNSIHQIPEKKKLEMQRIKQQKEKQERITRVLNEKLSKLELEFEEKIKYQDDDFLKKIDELKNPLKKK